MSTTFRPAGWQDVARDKPTERARRATLGPLYNFPWLVVMFVAATFVLDLFGWEGDTPADEYSGGQWAFNILFNCVLVPLPMIVALAVARHSRAHGADPAVARRAVKVNALVTVGWWLLITWGFVQDFVQ